MPILAKKPMTPEAEKLTRSEWKKAKEGFTHSDNDIGPRIDAVAKAYNKIKWDAFPTDTDDKNWRAKAETLAKTKLTYLAPLYKALDILDGGLANEYKENDAPKWRVRIEAFAQKTARLRASVDEFYLTLKIECTKQLSAKGATMTHNWGKDFAKAVEETRKVKGDAIYAYNGPAPVAIQLTLIDMGGKENVLLTQMLTDALNEEFDNAVAKAAMILDKANDKTELKLDPAERDKYIKAKRVKVEGALSGLLKQLPAQLESTATAKYESYAKTRQEYLDYKLKMTKKVVLGSVALTTSIIGTAGSAASLAAAAATAGASLPVSIAGLAMSIKGTVNATVKMGKLIHTLQQSAEAAGKSVQKHLTALQKEFSKNPKANSYLDAAKTVGNAAQEFLLGASFTTTVGTLSDDCSTWKSKTDGLLYTASQSAKTLMKLMEAVQKAKKDVSKISNKKKAAAVEKSIIKIEKKTNDIINNIIDNVTRNKTNLASVEKCAAEIAKLQKIRQANVPVAFDMMVKVGSIVLSVAEIGAGLAVTGLGGVSNVGEALLAANDGLSAAVGLVEMANDIYEDAKA